MGFEAAAKGFLFHIRAMDGLPVTMDARSSTSRISAMAKGNREIGSQTQSNAKGLWDKVQSLREANLC
jgi:hypothetical protein